MSEGERAYLAGRRVGGEGGPVERRGFFWTQVWTQTPRYPSIQDRIKRHRHRA
jgi:hypothetical protein